MTLPDDIAAAALADKDGRRLAARLFATIDVAPGALTMPRLEAELAVALAVQVGVDLENARAAGERFCRVCGCTQFTACRGADGPCSWAAPDLCSVCALYPEPD